MQTPEHIVVPEGFRTDLARAVQILKEEGCAEIFLFGSGLTGNIKEQSDIDLAIRGCPRGHFFRLLGRLLRELQRQLTLSILIRAPLSLSTFTRKESCGRLAEKVASQITFEMGQIDQLLASITIVVVSSMRPAITCWRSSPVWSMRYAVLLKSSTHCK